MSTVLIVDDDPINIQTLTLTLQNDGYLLYFTQKSLDALAIIEQIKPDLILLDVKMPVMSGFEVCQELKASENYKDIPIIFLSALGEEIDKLQGFNVGGEDYITKPYSPEEVSARVRVHLALRSKQRQLEQLREQDQQYFARINAIRDDILDQMQHDLKSPLASIKASTHLINRHLHAQDKRLEIYIERINHAVDDTLQVMEHLLEIAKLETGRSTRIQAMEIEPFIQRLIPAYQILAEKKRSNFLFNSRFSQVQ